MSASEDECLVYNDITFEEAAIYMTDLSTNGHLKFTSSQDINLEKVQGNYDDTCFLGNVAEKSRCLSSLMRICMLRCGNVQEDSWKHLIPPRMQERNLSHLDYKEQFGKTFTLPKDKAQLNRYNQLHERIFASFRVEKKLKQLDDDDDSNTPTRLDGGYIILSGSEFTLIRCSMKNGIGEDEHWKISVNISRGYMCGDRLEDDKDLLRRYFTVNDDV